MASLRPRPAVMSVTERAADRVRELIGSSAKPLAGVRVGVRKGGCAGMEYTLEGVETAGRRRRRRRRSMASASSSTPRRSSSCSAADGFRDDQAPLGLRLPQPERGLLLRLRANPSSCDRPPGALTPDGWCRRGEGAAVAFKEFLEDLYAPIGGVSVRGMFGGLGVFRDAIMFALVVDDVLYLRADEAKRAALREEKAPQFVYGHERTRRADGADATGAGEAGDCCGFRACGGGWTGTGALVRSEDC